MKTWTARFGIALAIILACVNDCPAGVVSKAVREAAEAATRRSGRAAREGVEALTKKSTRRLGSQGARGGALLARASDDVTSTVIAKFSDDGARALESLSPAGAERLAAMSDELAAGGRGRDWLRLIADRGDEVTDWLWERRGSVAIGTAATVVLLQPEEFIQASERVATTTINAAGEHVAGPVVERAATAIPWGALWLTALVVGAAWFLAKEKFAGFRRRLLGGAISAATHRPMFDRQTGEPLGSSRHVEREP